MTVWVEYNQRENIDGVASSRADSHHVIEFRFGRDIVQRLVQEKITGLAGVPSLWSLLAQPSSGLGKQSLSHLRYITNTGGAMPQNLLGQLRTLLPQAEVFLMYAGELTVNIRGNDIILKSGDVFTAEAGQLRTLSNTSAQPCEVYVVRGGD